MAYAVGSNWRENILSKLQERNRLQTQCFEELISQSEPNFDVN